MGLAQVILTGLSCNIGTPSGRIAVAGAEVVFSDFETDLNILVGDLRNMGSNVRAAATLELAFLSRLLGIVFGSIQGALACEAEGVPVSEFTSILPPGDRAIPLTETIHAGTFETISSGGASVDVAGEAVTGLYDHAVSAQHFGWIGSDVLRQRVTVARKRQLL
jgi:hypothetical protein